MKPNENSASEKNERLRERIAALGPWFHNMELAGIETAPEHFLGDYPRVKWRRFQSALPADLTGKSVLDIGCNAGFYAIEMKRRGAHRVLAIDSDATYLEQARFAAKTCGAQIEFAQVCVYDVAKLGERFDIVLFMGVLYHLRHPLLALDLIAEHVAKDLFVFQSMLRGARDIEPVAADYPFWARDHFDAPGYPKLHFIEHHYAGDPTNWWAPNKACAQAMLRSAGFDIIAHPEEEVFVCRLSPSPRWHAGAAYPARGCER